MDGDSWLSIASLTLLLVAAAYLSAAEAALLSVNRTRIRTMAEDGDRRARRTDWLLQHDEKALSTIQIGNRVLSLAFVTLAGCITVARWGMSYLPWTVLLTALVLFFAGELLPKSLGRGFAESAALGCSGFLCLLTRLCSPIYFPLASLGRLISRQVREPEEPSVTEDELYEMLDVIEEEGTIDEARSDLIRSAIEFDDRSAQDVLTARVDIVALEAGMSPEEILSVIKGNSHSRLPVYEGSIDNIVGVLQIRKYLRAYLHTGGRVDLPALLDKPFFTHKSTSIDDLLRTMSREKINLSIVTDDYGGVLGLVTVEDILEELVGEIWDEDDIVTEDFMKLGGYRYEVSSDMQVTDVFDEMEYEDYDEEEFEHLTMGGWALEALEDIPKEGESFTYRSLTVTISRMKGNRIIKLIVQGPPPDLALPSAQPADAAPPAQPAAGGDR